MANITPGGSVITDWTAVAQNTLVHSDIIDIGSDLEAMLILQAFLDTTTGHTGTEIIVQISHKDSGDEDWADLTRRNILIGTAVADAIENAPLGIGETAITLTGHAYTVIGKWLAIKNGTLLDSELVMEKSQTANEVVIVDGVTNAHVATTPMYNVAFSDTIAYLTAAVRRVRIIVNNAYDPDGSTLNYRLMISRATDIE